MTREHKLALIVGFSILLLVGVLISDHLSRARETQIDTVLLEPAAAIEPLNRSVPVDPLGPVNRSALADTTSPAVNPQVLDPLLAGPSTAAPSGSPLLADASTPRGNLPEAGLGGEGSLESAIRNAGGVITPGADGVREVMFADPALPRADPGPALPKPANAADKTYIVRKNDTLFAIAKREYGDAGLWPMLSAYNKDRVGKNGSLREGQPLRIPTRAVLTGKPDPAPQKPAPDARSLAGQTRIASNRTYTVKKNDTLGDVSRAMYGTSKRWPDILAANRSVIDNKDRLTVGMVLKVPG